MNAGARVLIVDDEPMVAAALRRQLIRRGFLVETCASAEEALARIANGAEPLVGTVITDFQMPGLNGLELLRELGRRAPRIVRVLLSGYSYGEAEQPASGPDFDLWVRKPWNADELASNLLRLLPKIDV